MISKTPLRSRQVTSKKIPTAKNIRAFQKMILDHYRVQGRDLPWRRTRNPFRILVSEIMLQQTQVERVLDKYKQFLGEFPNLTALANAPLHTLLSIWQGMGYNRRALALKSLAQKVVSEHAGKLPSDPDVLLTLPGIGPYTAGAVAAFAFNKPVLFIDTNIRRVFIHVFFQDQENITDTQILLLVERTLDARDPRTWYNALMDYGATLKQTQKNPNRKSAHYQRQSPFENSNRQVRGRILKTLIALSSLTVAEIVNKVGADAEQVENNLVQMQEEGFIKKKGRTFAIAQDGQLA